MRKSDIRVQVLMSHTRKNKNPKKKIKFQKKTLDRHGSTAAPGRRLLLVVAGTRLPPASRRCRLQLPSRLVVVARLIIVGARLLPASRWHCLPHASAPDPRSPPAAPPLTPLPSTRSGEGKKGRGGEPDPARGEGGRPPDPWWGRPPPAVSHASTAAARCRRCLRAPSLLSLRAAAGYRLRLRPPRAVITVAAGGEEE